ncbi:MAG: sodium-dependent transporter [Cyclobacteriaceae bacterium]|nr:sodium-dependent transporter [Cyclobacteriaceae bacterium]MCB0500865.1 sodium-dependent transporter [Cyclobacteriaceae bacterium]MCB9238446.1 sodium-dependent transporter [Flammeovirgaceae bacterium]MCW5903861.1 sodium-dependent transporter [Cyclobacteriaceae bacterium]
MANRGQFGSKFGFIMAAAGSAVGLGNIWRFPYLTGENGGGAFVFVYLCCVLAIGVPLLFNEIALGRLTGKNPIGAFKDTGSNNFWIIGAILSLCVSFFVTSYYGVIAGWTIGYIYTSLMGTQLTFAEFTANPYIVLMLFAVFIGLNLLIVTKDIAKGIEKASKILMPILFVLVFVVIIRSVTLDGAMAGVKYYLIPDFSKINGATFLKALSQCFFSMSIGWGIMITYGSYLSKNESIVKSALWIGVLDTGVALMGGLMIFPAVFAFGMEPNQGPTLVFQILPHIFGEMPGGNIVGAFFFLLLCIAALTSTISMIEVPGSWLIDEKKWSRKKAAWAVAIAALVVGIPSALSKGANDTLTHMSMTFSGITLTSFMDIMDFVWGSFFIIIVALFICLYVGWVIGPTRIIAELSEGTPSFATKKFAGLSAAQVWAFFIRFVCPLVIIIVILNQFNIF